MVSKKQLIELASNPEIMDYLQDIAYVQSNTTYKTGRDLQNAKREMNKYAGYIIDILNGNYD